MKKSTILALSILSVFLLCSLSYNPVLANIEDNKRIEFTLEVIGCQNVYKQKVTITEEAEIELYSIFNGLENRLTKINSRGEVFPLLEEVVVKLKDIGLLKVDSNIKDTWNLFNIEYQNKKLINLNDDSNNICFIVGKTTKCTGVPLIGNLYLRLFNIFSEFDLIALIFRILIVYSLFPYLYLPYLIGGSLTFGIFRYGMFEHQPSKYIPSDGWIWTLGLNGIKSWNGSFYGQITHVPVIYSDILVGAIGFTGLKIYESENPEGDCFILGSALKVSIDENHQ